MPLGKLTVVDGDPGLGKSTMLLDLGARVTMGRRMPDGSPPTPGTVVLATAEDGIADTVRPRFDAAGGDPSRLLVLDGVAAGEDRPLCLPDDVALLRAELATRGDLRLIIIDPFMAYLSGFVNSRIDHDVRRTLAPLAQLAADAGAAIVLVRHLNKAPGGSALYRGGGSIGIIGAARAGLLVAADPEDDQRRVLAPTKSNLAPPAPSLSFHLTSTPSGVACVEWLGESAHAANALVAQMTGDEERGAFEEAKDFLRDFMAIPRTAAEVRRAAREAGVSERTLLRAKAVLGVRSEKAGGPGAGWVWKIAKAPYSPTVGNLGNVGNLSYAATSYEAPEIKGCQAGENGSLTPPLGAGDAWEPEPPPALTVTDRGAGRYVVSGGAAPHEVTLRGSAASCDCADHVYRKRECKHIRAAREAGV
jgi:hypothetical protein